MTGMPAAFTALALLLATPLAAAASIDGSMRTKFPLKDYPNALTLDRRLDLALGLEPQLETHETESDDRRFWHRRRTRQFAGTLPREAEDANLSPNDDVSASLIVGVVLLLLSALSCAVALLFGALRSSVESPSKPGRGTAMSWAEVPWETIDETPCARTLGVTGDMETSAAGRDSDQCAPLLAGVFVGAEEEAGTRSRSSSAGSAAVML
jgi:hypothetical protein